MVRKHWRRVVVALSAASILALATIGTAVAESPVTTADAENGFKGLKRIEAPKNCPAEQGRTDNEIKVGVITALTGPLATSYGQDKWGIDARFQEANDNKELGKYKISTVYVDDAGNTAKNATAAQQLNEQEKVWAVLETTGNADGGAQYLYDQGIPVVGWHLFRPPYGMYPNMFGYRLTMTKDGAKNYNSRNVDFIKSQGGKKIALVAINSPAAVLAEEQNADMIKKTKGVELSYRTNDIPVGATDVSSYADEIKKSGADSVYYATDVRTGLALSAALKQAGANIKVAVFPGGYDPASLTNPATDQGFFLTEFKPLETKPVPKGMKDYFNALPAEAPQNLNSATGWLIADTFIKGLKEAGLSCPTRDAFITNLRLVDDWTADGWFDPTSFREVWNRTPECGYYVQAVNGKFVPVNKSEQICAKKVVTNGTITDPTATTTTVAPTTTTAAT